MLAIYTAENCQMCRLTIALCNRDSIPYVLKSAEDEADYLKGLGIQQAPGVVITDSDGVIQESWGGFRPQNFKKYKPTGEK